MKFLRNFLASLLALVLFFFGLFWIVVSIATAEQLVLVEEGSVIQLKLNKPVTEREFENPFEDIPGFPGARSSIGLVELRASLENAATDDNIRGVALMLDGFSAGMAHIEEIREIIRNFKASGKFVHAFADNYSEGGYYLASIADSVFLHPEGNLEFNGLSANVVFFKRLFEKIGVQPEIFRVGDFKSAVEPFMREEMSEESRLQMTQLLEGMMAHMLTNISVNRNIPFDSIQKINDQMLVRNAEQAKSYGLVDGLTYSDEFRSAVAAAAGSDTPGFISYSEYRNSYKPLLSARDRIAVIVASGDIMLGEGGQDIITSGEFVKTIREARENDRVKAIVLRVNSPGGSYLASDAIWREVSLAALEKPVIASMSNYAASGGYYIAMASDTIVAQPTTITGSIGIFSILFNIQELFEDKLGITFDAVSTGEFSNLYTSSRELRPEEKQIIQQEVNNNYDTFIRKAANGRNMPEASIRKIASGRVWSGVQAKEEGLIDVFGGLDTAIRLAAEKAGLTDDYSLRYYPPQKSVLEQILGMDQASAMQSELGMLYPFVREVQNLEKLQGIQARSIYSLEIY